MTQNTSFEDSASSSLESWDWRDGLEAELVSHDFVGKQLSKFDNIVGSYHVRLRGSGGFGQVVVIPSDAERLLLNVMAYQQRVDGQAGQNSWEPRAHITFYDENWNEVGRRETLIAEVDRRQATGLNPYTLGITVVPDTKYALVAIFSYDAGVEVFVDYFALYDATDRSPDTATKNLVFNTPLISTIDQDNNQNDYFLLGNEFWYTQLNLADHPEELLRWGSTNQAEWAWQPVDVVENRLYQISVDANRQGESEAEVGLDFFDAQGTRLQRRVFAVEETSASNRGVPFVAPAGTQFTTAHFLVPQLSGEGPSDPELRGAGAPHIVILDIGTAPSSESETTTYYTDRDFYTPRYPQGLQDRGWSLRLWFRDQDGLDENSIAIVVDEFGVRRKLRDIYFTSLSNPNLEYNAFHYSVRYSPPQIEVQDEGREVGVGITVFVDNIGDLGNLVIREGAIKDKLGNSNARIEYERFTLPWETP